MRCSTSLRLHEARERLGLGERVVFDVHAFPLEVVNGQPTPKKVLDAEIPVAGALEVAERLDRALRRG